MKNIKSFQKEILHCRTKLKKNRKRFWENNKKTFCKNVVEILRSCELPKDWKTYVVASNFLSDKEILPFDYNSWSNVNLVAATKKQGFEIMVFINRSRAEFLSRPAIVPLILHEAQHIRQAANNPKNFTSATLNDEVAKSFEKDAEKHIRFLSDEFRKEAVLESVLYCYDIGSWNYASKMANFFYKERENIYSGGYDKDMTDSEFNLFQKAKREKKINLFIDYFCASLLGGKKYV